MIRVTVWNENIHDREVQEVKDLYPLGIHGTLAAYLNTLEGVEARTATLEQPECGLPDEVLNNTDVMIWWGHCGHHLVPDELARKVADRVLGGMGLIVLHSGHYSKPFRLLMGTTCSLRWRDGDFERMWCMNPGHPSPKVSPLGLSWKRKRCTASISIFPIRMKSSSAAGSAAASCSAPAAAGTAGRGRSSTSSPATRQTPPTTTPMS